jgi:DNA invertase Pin-like site-specific DNA recombinase
VPGRGWPLEPQFYDGRVIRGAAVRARRRGPRGRAEIEKERRELWERTVREIDAIAAEFHALLPRKVADAIGAIYARFSTRHQDSVPAQVRAIFEDAVKLKIFIPREMIFFDLAVRGFKNDRQGLGQLRTVLANKKVQVLLLFSTSRLFRKQYRTLAFVDQVHKGWGLRCIFTRSGVDTNDKQRWETILATQAMIDQFVVTMYVANVQEAHKGLLDKRMVFGTISFGYRGDPIDGMVTKRGRPRCRIVIDPETAEIVLRIFTWYVEEGLSIDEIVRRLNSDPSIPLPPRCLNEEWTRLAVRRILTNTRYIGLWKYGCTESVYVPEGDYVRQNMRAEPLREVDIPELRIVPDELFARAQARLGKEARKGGRQSGDKTRSARSKLLSGLHWCSGHQRPLQLGGGVGLFCPRCRRLPVEHRSIYSKLPPDLALQRDCEKMAELVQADEALVHNIIKSCQQEAESLQRPDPGRLQNLRAQRDKLTRSIEFNMRQGGETDEDQAEIVRVLKELRHERAEVAAEIGTWEAASQRPRKIPTEEEVREMLQDLAEIFAAAARGDSLDVAQVREIIDAITGGRIEMYQQGERAAKRGWLQGRFKVRLLDFLVEKASGVPPAEAGEAIEVTIDYRRPEASLDKSERAYHLCEHKGWLKIRIAKHLGVSKSRVTKLLHDAYARRGQEMPDGRSRRSTLAEKHQAVPVFQSIADDVKAMLDQGMLIFEIADALGVDKATVTKAKIFWYTSRGLTPPDGRSRRKTLTRKVSHPRRRPGEKDGSEPAK